MNRFVYTAIYLLLANRLYIAFHNQASRMLESDVLGVQPILEIVLVGLCILFCILTYKKGKLPVNAKWMSVFLIYVLLISIFHGVLNGFHKKTAVFTYAQPLLLLLVEYYAQQDEKVRKFTPFLVKALAVWIVFLFLWTYRSVALATMESFYTTNTSYYLLYFLPMLFLFLKDKNKNIIFLVALIVIVLSSKRGGLLALLLGYLAYNYTYRISNRKGLFRFVIVTVVLIGAFIWLNYYMGGRIVDRLEVALDDEGHGRFDIWAIVWAMIQDSDFFHACFGHGFGSVMTDAGIGFSAHNDYLEVIYDFGWVGLLLFAIAIVAWFVHGSKLIKMRSGLAPIVMMALLIFVSSCTVSHIVIYIESFNLFALFFGALAGIEKRNRIIQNSV